MRRAMLPVMFLGSVLLPLSSPAQNAPLTPENLPDFLGRYEQSFSVLESTYADLANVDVSLRDEKGQHMGRRRIEDRRKNLTELREKARGLAKDPGNLALTATLFIRNEALSDDLFDLAQIAYDNNVEELGRRFSDLENTFEDYQSMLEAYTLKLADQKQDRIRELESENQKLQQKLKESEAKSKEVKGRQD